jgi:hypothetical protein
MLNKIKKTVKFVLISLVAGVTFVSTAEAGNIKVEQSMAMLKIETSKLGKPKIENGNLHFGTSKINDNFTVVDAIKEKNGGTATIFVKKDNSYVRISTNVIKDGNRAIGTQLDPKGPAFAAINQGKAFYGIVDILGKLYDTGYEPITSDKGEIIGILYVGYIVE